MRYLSVCSGIEAASCAWHPLGWTPVAFSEIEKFPASILSEHYPETPNWGDMTKFKEWPDADVDVLVGGTPCQSFSVAGLRKGLADPRGNLMLTYLAIADRYRPAWVVWENVPGVLSSNGGRDFGTFLGGLGELGYGFAYRVLDAQYFGVAQRRRRVFVVGCLGDWRPAAAVLFERRSLQGHPAPSRKAGEDVAGAVTQRIDRGGVNSEGGDGHLIPAVAKAIKTMSGGIDRENGRTLVVAPTLNEQGLVPVAFDLAQITSKTNRTRVNASLPASTLNAAGQMHVATAMQVRRLTPRECERLQGFPDDYTLITVRNKPAADGPRYKALGNSMAVPVMAWIGKRIQMVETATARELEVA